MSTERGNGSVAADRLAGLLSWWGMAGPTDTAYEGQLKRLQSFASDVQQLYAEAYGRQMERLFAANEHLAQALQGLVHIGKPADFVAAQSELFAAVLDEASVQATSWADLMQKLQGCCAAVARDTAEDIHGHRETVAPAAPHRPSHGAAVRGAKHREAV